MRMSRALDFGCVWINTHIPLVAEMPHGGFKHSGYGKALCMDGFEDYTRIKHVMSALDCPPAAPPAPQPARARGRAPQAAKAQASRWLGIGRPIPSHRGRRIQSWNSYHRYDQNLVVFVTFCLVVTRDKPR